MVGENCAQRPVRAFPHQTFRRRIEGVHRYGFETLPIEPLAIALVFLACAQAFGATIVVLELLALGAILAVTWRTAGAMLRDNLALLALPLFAVVSAFWSELPAVSLRYGAQLVITAVIGITIVRSVPASHLARIVFFGTAAATVIGIAIGRTGPSPEGPVLIGLTGSKNQMGYITLFWLVASLSVLSDRGQAWWLRLVAAISVVPAMYLILTGQVTTALVLAAIAIAATSFLLLFRLLSLQARILTLVSAILLSFSVFVSLPQITAYGDRFRADTLGKDERLTGRTLLWEAAETLVAERPLLGHGYRAVWLGETGKGLLARFGLSDGRTFNFHSTIIELRVDLGIVGVALLALTLLLSWARLLMLLINGVTSARIFAALALLTISGRMFTELVIAPFLLDTILLFAVLASIFQARTVESAEARAGRSQSVRSAPPHTILQPLPQERTTMS